MFDRYVRLACTPACQVFGYLDARGADSASRWLAPHMSVVQDLDQYCHGSRRHGERGVCGVSEFSQLLIIFLQDQQNYLIIRHAVVDQESTRISDGESDDDDELVQESEPDPVSDKQKSLKIEHPFDFYRPA